MIHTHRGRGDLRFDDDCPICAGAIGPWPPRMEEPMNDHVHPTLRATLNSIMSPPVPAAAEDAPSARRDPQGRRVENRTAHCLHCGAVLALYVEGETPHAPTHTCQEAP